MKKVLIMTLVAFFMIMQSCVKDENENESGDSGNSGDS